MKKIQIKSIFAFPLVNITLSRRVDEMANGIEN
jgi:hypothetical protein